MIKLLFIGGPKHGQSIDSANMPSGSRLAIPISGKRFIYHIHAVRDPDGHRQWVAVTDDAMLSSMIRVGFCEREH